MKKKKIVVCGGAGFIGHHLCNRLAAEQPDAIIDAVDIKAPHYRWQWKNMGWKYRHGDLRDPSTCYYFLKNANEVYQLAADMGGAGYVFTGENDAKIISDNALINLGVARACVQVGVEKVFFASSACIYPQENQQDPDNPKCAENTAYPANPDSDYGWEKLFSERVWMAMQRNFNLDVRIGRFHNIYGPEGAWEGGREKAPAAMCRKAAELAVGEKEVMEVWGSGRQTRSFLWIDDALDAVYALMNAEKGPSVWLPMNIGSEEMLSIEVLAMIALRSAGFTERKLPINFIDGPIGVMGRNSDNNMISLVTGWRGPKVGIFEGMSRLYKWVLEEVIVRRKEAKDV